MNLTPHDIPRLKKQADQMRLMLKLRNDQILKIRIDNFPHEPYRLDTLASFGMLVAQFLGIALGAALVCGALILILEMDIY